MHPNSKFSSWTSFYRHLSSSHQIAADTIHLSDTIVQDLKTEFGLEDSDFSLGKSKLLTYYNQANTVFGNIRFNKSSLRIEVVFSGDTSVPMKVQADGYRIHSFLVQGVGEYQRVKETVFQLLQDAYSAIE